MTFDQQIGRRIGEAREFLGLTQSLLASRMGLARTTQVAIEQGRRPASVADLYRYSEVLSRPLDYFLGTGVWGKADFGPQLRALVERLDATLPRATGQRGRPRRSSAPSSERRALALFGELSRDYLELEELNGLARTPMPQLPLPRQHSALEAERLAAMARAHMDLGPDVPISGLRVRLEEAFALRVFVVADTGRLSAAAFHHDAVGGCVLLAERPTPRRRFSLAHALGHLVRNPNEVMIDVHEGNKHTPAEAFALAFAAHLLVPSRGLRERFAAIHRDVGELNDVAALFLARTFGVSLKVLAGRLRTLKLASQEQLARIDAAAREANASRQSSNGAAGLPDAEHWAALPERFVFLALRAQREGLIDRSRLAHFLRTTEPASALQLLDYLTSVRDGDAARG
jgi:Zn-dependent peptidase ImmA (M78 family)/transcriptional regulator with XRE-family HTH domain